MKIFTLVVILIAISMFVGGTALYVSDVNSNYKLNLTETEFKTFQKLNTTQDLAVNVAETITGSTTSESNVVELAISGGISGLKLLAKLPELFGTIVYDGFNTVQKYTGIPVVFQAGISALILIVLMFGLLYAIFKIRF